jgi:glycogen phosphorylase
MAPIDEFLPRTHIAYFSMEIALSPDMHTYSGGLGILAGDTARSAADLELPMVFVTLASRQGYLRQEIDAGGPQVAHPDPWALEEHATPLHAMVAVEMDGRNVWIRPWLHVLTCPIGHRLPIILLDTELDQNDPGDRDITARLYGGDHAYRLKQEIVLGIGGERVLRALGFQITTYHMNEGHAALLPVALLNRLRRDEPQQAAEPAWNVQAVIQQCVFTTHTPVEAGHDQFDYALVDRLMGNLVDRQILRRFAGSDRLNMTRLALNLSGYVNGVARRHAETASKMFPGYRIRAITNGVHVPTWAHPAFAELYQSLAPNWGHEPEVLVHADQLGDDQVRRAHQRAKSDLIDAVRILTGRQLDASLPTIGFARRMTGYKRPELLFTDPERLARIADRHPFQLVMAGKAHPADAEGQRAIERLHRQFERLPPAIAAVFLPNYEFALAKVLVAGVDIWLNSPTPPLEASGTSGMKAAVNGVLNLSVLDGWWLEACVEDVTGWAIGADRDGPEGHADALYAKLEKRVLPLYADEPDRWAWMMKEAISKIGARFTSQHMMRRYASEAYLR